MMVAVEAKNQAIRYNTNGWSFTHGSAVSRRQGSSLTFQFIGTRLSWVGSVGSTDPEVAAYTIDELMTIPFPIYPPSLLSPSSSGIHGPAIYTVFETPSLSPGPHNVTVVNRREGSSLSLSYLLVQDEFKTPQSDGNGSGEGMQPLYRRRSEERMSKTAVLAGVFGSFGFFILAACLFLFVRRRTMRRRNDSERDEEKREGAVPQVPLMQVVQPHPKLPSVPEPAIVSERRGPSSSSSTSSSPLSRRSTRQRDLKREIANMSRDSPRMGAHTLASSTDSSDSSSARDDKPLLKRSKFLENVQEEEAPEWTGSRDPHRRPTVDLQQSEEKLGASSTNSPHRKASKETLGSRRPRGIAQSEQEDLLGSGRTGTPVPVHPPLKFSDETVGGNESSKTRSPRVQVDSSEEVGGTTASEIEHSSDGGEGSGISESGLRSHHSARSTQVAVPPKKLLLDLPPAYSPD